MALPNSGALSAEQINIEIKRASQALMSLNDADVRTLGQKPSGEISYSDLRGKSFIALDGGDLTWTDNTYTYVAFTSPGTLQVNQPVSVTYIVVGGGGGAVVVVVLICSAILGYKGVGALDRKKKYLGQIPQIP